MVNKTVNQNIPQGWKETKLSELLVEINERNREQAELPVLSVTNSRGFVLQSEQFARNVHSKNTSNYKIVSKEQFAYNPARINVGSIALLRKWEKGLLSPMYVVFGTKDELLNDYLQYYIQSPRFSVQVSNNTAGSVRKSLNFNAFEKFDYAYPESKEEQKKVVEVLASIDEVIKKTEEVIKVTEKLKKGLMQQLFTQGIGHTKFKKTELGEIPEDWNVVKLEDVAQLSTGTTPATSKQAYYQGSTPFIKTAQVANNRINGTEVFVSEEAISDYRLKVYKPGTVFMAMYGQGKTRGQVALLETEGCTTQNAAAIEPGKKLDSEYLWFFFKSQYEQLRQGGVHGLISHLSLTVMKQYQMSLPSLTEQKEIARILNSVDEKILVNKKLVAKQTELKKGLMQDLLSGKVRVVN